MEPLLHFVEPAQFSFPPFAWACELARKIKSDIMVWGSKNDFVSSEAFRAQMETLSHNYQEMYHPDENPAAPRCIPVFSNEALSISLPALSGENPISLIIFPPHLLPNETLLQHLNEQQQAYIQLPPELPYDTVGLTNSKGHLSGEHTFYAIYQQADKFHLTDDFFRQLAKDNRLSRFLVDYFRNQPEASEEI